MRWYNIRIMEDDSVEINRKQLEEIIQRSVYIKQLKSVLLSKDTESDQYLKLVIFKLHEFTEDIFDRILLLYICPQHPDRETIDSIPANSDPKDVCKHLVFNFGFHNKLDLICDVFQLKNIEQSLKVLNKVRNGLAHRYDVGHEYFKYRTKNVLQSIEGLELFIKDVLKAIEEVLNIDELLGKYFE